MHRKLATALAVAVIAALGAAGPAAAAGSKPPPVPGGSQNGWDHG